MRRHEYYGHSDFEAEGGGALRQRIVHVLAALFSGALVL